MMSKTKQLAIACIVLWGGLGTMWVCLPQFQPDRMCDIERREYDRDSYAATVERNRELNLELWGTDYEEVQSKPGP